MIALAAVGMLLLRAQEAADGLGGLRLASGTDQIGGAALERLDELEVEYGENLFEGMNGTATVHQLLEMAAAANLTSKRSAKMIVSQMRSGRSSVARLVDTWSKAMLKHKMRERLRKSGAREERAEEIRRAKVRACSQSRALAAT